MHEENEGENLRVIDKTGTTTNYMLHPGRIYFMVNSLTVYEIFVRSFSKSSLPEQVSSKRVVKGFATLGDRDIDVPPI
jgi:hypothetical protein